MTDDESKRTVNRSPEHPAVDLPTALERAQELYDAEGFNWTSPDVALTHWGYSPKASSGDRTLAALKHFGLVEDTGSAKERRVRLSDLARRIIRDKREHSPERELAIREAALSPSIYRKLWDEWAQHGRLPSQGTMEYELEHTWDFNPKAVDGFIRDFVSTVEFADLLGEHDTEDAETDKGGARREAPGATDQGHNQTDNAKQAPANEEHHSLGSGTAAKRNRLDFPIPLISGERAVLTLPVPLSEADFALLVQMLQTTLPLMKPAIVRATDGGLIPSGPVGETAADR